MSDVDPNIVLIPPEWRTAVAGILRSGDRKRIHTTRESDRTWEAAFPSGEDAWDYVRFDAMAIALENPCIQGQRITTMKEPGETYEFFFTHRNNLMYGKINLKPDGKIILIYSSHTPRKGEKLL